LSTTLSLAISLPEIKQWSIANYRFRVRSDLASLSWKDALFLEEFIGS
ncbi:hypothetical protein CEXT_321302, partial [Caerostris extrusa]